MTAFLFDLDGTLVNTIPSIVAVSRLTLDELGLAEVTEAEILSLIGVPLYDTGIHFLGEGGGEIFREVYQRHHFAQPPFELQPYPGIDELLARLTAADGRLACVTSKRQEGAEQALRETGLRRYFPVLISADSCSVHKPDPLPALMALEQLGEPAAGGAMIGDSVFDIGCAVNAGLRACGVTWGAGQAAELLAAGAEHLAATAAELAGILLGA